MKKSSSLRCLLLALSATTVLISLNAQAQFGGRPDEGPGRPGMGPGGPGDHRPPGPPVFQPHPPPYQPPYGGNRVWQSAGTACGPQQPWGTSLMCSNTSPNGGPIGQSCDGVAPGTKCYGSSYYDPGFGCSDPYNGSFQTGSNVFNMYECN